MIGAAEREKLATRIYRECVTRAYPEQEVTFNHTRCVELLALCANEALERVAGICDYAANGTIEKMSEDGRSETWKIVAEQSVEQYRSIAQKARALKAEG